MAPTPKPEGMRERRNRDQRQWRTVTRGAVPIPPMPGETSLGRRQRAVAVEYWTALWTDLGEIYVDTDRHAIARLCRLHARSMVGRLSAQAEGELRQLEAAFGGSPLARQRMMIRVVDPDASAPGDDDDGGSVVDMEAQRARRARIAAAPEPGEPR